MGHIEQSRDGGVVTVRLNRPEKLNAMAGTMREDLAAALKRASDDPATRVIVITGTGRAFCAGGDVDYMARLQTAGDESRFLELLDAGAEVVRSVEASRVPVIASVNGVAAGAGLNLALACDYRIAARSAKLGATFTRIGLHPDWGGTWTLPRLAGFGHAFALMATGAMISADEARALGIVESVVDDADLAPETARLVTAIAAAPPIAIEELRKSLRRARQSTLQEQLAIEREAQLRAFRSADAAEGMAAFFEKRAAAFRGE